MSSAGLLQDLIDANANGDAFEGLTWHNMGKPLRPDADMRVLVFTRENDVLMATWDDEFQYWADCETGTTLDDVTHWAEPMGPGA